MSQFAGLQPVLHAAGVETLAVINTPAERARLYFRYRPTPATLLSDPDFLILDEPTSVLTPDEADEVLGLVKQLTRDKQLTALIITHKFRCPAPVSGKPAS